MASMAGVLSGQAVRDPRRLEAVRATGLLDGDEEVTFQRFTKLAARMLQCPVSLISFVDRDRQFFVAATGLESPWRERRQTPLDYSFCQHVVTSGSPLRVTDARRDPRVASNLAVEALGVIAYLGVPIASDDGYVLGSFCAIDGMARDWSEEDLDALQELGHALAAEVRLRERTAALADLLKEREGMEEDRERTLRLLVHDLRTPIAAVVSTLEIVESEPDEIRENAELLALARDGANEILAMLNQMLEVHRIKAGKLALECTRFPAAALLREVALQMRVLVEAQAQALQIDYPDPALEITADRNLLKRVLVNLVSNAVKYAGSGAEIVIGARVEATARFWVEDNGPGIPTSEQDRIFDAFDRGGHHTVVQDGSFGLGLSFCRLALEGHGGSIGVRSREGGGTRFELELPGDPKAGG